MKNLKKITLLLSILTVFAISCKDAQQAVSSTFDVITDDPTSVPDNPPSIITKPDLPQFPEDFIFKTKDIYFESPDSRLYYLTVNVDRGSLSGKALSFKTYASFESRTTGVANPAGVLSAFSFRDAGLANQVFIDVAGSLYSALGSSGQRAKVKLEIYIDTAGYSTGVRTVYIDIYRR